MSKTIHLILNAHLDPIWLWSWPSGLDAGLATFRAACDLLESHPEARFTQGEAWLYHEIEGTDPALFGRVRALIERDRWHVTGGWWIQPDCNLAGSQGLIRQIRLGLAYFRDRFGRTPREGFNVDSFGHPATLPSLLHACGQDRYVMMRPQEHEMALPARLFRWRERPGGPEVLCFRVAGAYATFEGDLENHLRQATTELPRGVDQTMGFVGVGDHGGGPTRAQVAWIDAHHKLDGWRLVYSTPERFFDAVADRAGDLPLVTGELQHHAIGAYSVFRQVKRAVRRTEGLLEAAEQVVSPVDDRLVAAWQDVCLAHFHDVLAGTSVPSAYLQICDRLGRAAAVADELTQRHLRRLVAALAPDRRERIALFNPGPRAFSGSLIHERSMLEDRRAWSPAWRLVDASGVPVRYQVVQPEAAVDPTLMTGLLFRAELAPGELSVLRIDREAGEPGPPPTSVAWVRHPTEALETSGGVSVEPGAEIMTLGDRRFALPRLELLPDRSDTWSHGLTRYDGRSTAAVRWGRPRLVETGPLRAAVIQLGQVGSVRLSRELSVGAGERSVELILQVEWTARHRILKLVIEPGEPIASRIDGIPAGWTSRPCPGPERPLRGWTLLELASGKRLGVACPEVFALDAGAERVGLTLLRAPLLAHHDPHRAARSPRALHADRGVHRFRLVFVADDGLDPEELDDLVWSMDHPPMIAETTLGMGG